MPLSFPHRWLWVWLLESCVSVSLHHHPTLLHPPLSARLNLVFTKTGTPRVLSSKTGFWMVLCGSVFALSPLLDCFLFLFLSFSKKKIFENFKHVYTGHIHTHLPFRFPPRLPEATSRTETLLTDSFLWSLLVVWKQMTGTGRWGRISRKT